MANGPVFVKRTVRDCAVLNITVGFRGGDYISPWPAVGGSLGSFESFLDLLEQVLSSLSLTLLSGCILESVRAS